MRQFILFICIVFITVIYAPKVSGQFASPDGIPRNLEFHDVAGTAIPIGDHSNVDGSPFLNNNWSLGILRLKNGAMFSDSSVNFSLFNDEFFLKRNDTIYPVNYPVTEFIISYTGDASEKKTYYFKNGFPANHNNDSLTFYEVLFGGRSLELLKWKHKKIQEINNYASVIKRQYVLTEEYFIFFPRENKMIELGPKVNLNILRKNLPEFKNQLTKYFSNRKLQIKSDGELIRLISFLDSQITYKPGFFIFNIFNLLPKISQT